MTDNLAIVTHPLVQHKLSLMRDKSAPTPLFRQLLRKSVNFWVMKLPVNWI